MPTVLVDKSPLFRAGLIHIFAGSRYRFKTGASKLSELAQSVFGDKRCVALVSLDGEEVAAILSQVRSLTEQYKDLHIITLTERFSSEELLAAIEAGADGYLLRNEISAAALLLSLDLVLLGGVVIQGFTLKKRVPPQLNAVLALQDSEAVSERGQLQPTIDATQTDNMVRMSEREQTILMHLMEGASNKHIARELNIAEATVKVHVKSLLIKIRVKNRTQAAMWAMGRVRPNGQLEQRPVSFPTGVDREKISATIPNGDSANSRNELRAAAGLGQVHAEIDFKGGFG